MAFKPYIVEINCAEKFVIFRKCIYLLSWFEKNELCTIVIFQFKEMRCDVYECALAVLAVSTLTSPGCIFIFNTVLF